MITLFIITICYVIQTNEMINQELIEEKEE